MQLAGHTMRPKKKEGLESKSRHPELPMHMHLSLLSLYFFFHFFFYVLGIQTLETLIMFSRPQILLVFVPIHLRSYLMQFYEVFGKAPPKPSDTV
jgi:hypothetical protein